MHKGLNLGGGGGSSPYGKKIARPFFRSCNCAKMGWFLGQNWPQFYYIKIASFFKQGKF